MENIKCDTCERVFLGGTGFMYLTSIEGKDYLFKPGVNKSGTREEPFRVDIQKTGYEIQKIVDKKTSVEVFTGFLKLPPKGRMSYHGSLYGSFQPKIENKDNFPIMLTSWQRKGNNHLSVGINNQLLRESITDYLLYNFDQNGANFILDKEDMVRGIDKEQSLKHVLDNDSSIDLNYNPNLSYGSCEPVLHTLIKRFIDGEEYAYLPTVYTYISRVEEIDDKEYLSHFEPYLYNIKQSLNLSDINIKNMIEKILERKHNLREVFSNMFIDAINKRKPSNISENKELTNMLSIITKEITLKR